MRNLPIIITGCQRSGTTLVHLILDSHPEIHGVDERDYTNEKIREFLDHPDYHPIVSLKQPISAHGVHEFKKLPRRKVIWIVRDPRDVVVSMISLHLQLNNTVSVSWAAHPLAVEVEIRKCLSVLDTDVKQKLAPALQRYEGILKTTPPLRELRDVVFTAALCWRIKQELLPIYEAEQVTYHLVYYERLISSPEHEIRNILQYVGVPWHDNVLKHHEFHSGKSIGATINTRPIDAHNTGKWKDKLSEAELTIINELCGTMARHFGYPLLG